MRRVIFFSTLAVLVAAIAFWAGRSIRPIGAADVQTARTGFPLGRISLGSHPWGRDLPFAIPFENGGSDT